MMETLLPSSRFAFATSKAVALPLATTKFTPHFVRISSESSLSKPIQIITRCTHSQNSVVVMDRLNNPASPWLMLPSVADETTGEMLDCFHSLADGQTVRLNRKKSLQVPDTAKCIASTMSWLGFVDTKDGSVYLSNPFLNDVVQLPSLETLPLVLGVQRDPKTNAILNFKVRPSEPESLWGHAELDPCSLRNPEFMSYHISNLTLSRDDPRGCDCVVMALQGEFRRLAYCPIYRQFTQDTDYDGFDHQFDPNCWTGLQEDYFPGLPFNQVVYDDHRGLFYTMFEYTGIQAFDVHRDRGRRSKMVFFLSKDKLNLQLKLAYDKQQNEALKALRNRCWRRNYLLTLENGDVFLILRYYETPKEYKHNNMSSDPHKTIHFDVFRVVYPGYLEHITCLNNDRAIFIGWNQSFCIKASSSPGVDPNCIYFTDDVSSSNYNVHSLNQWGHDIGIFSMEDGSISSCYPYEDEEEQKKVPLSTPLFWVAPLSSDITYLAREHGVNDKLSISG